MGWIAGNRYLSESEMQNNALLINTYLQRNGWTVNAVAALLGNMQEESTINPWIWESLQPYGGGFGLVQWTPYSKYADWAGVGWETTTYKQLDRILWELDNGEQYYPTNKYPETFYEFSRSTKSAYYLAGAFLYNYERPAAPDADRRGKLGEKWYTFLTGQPPVTRGVPVWLLYKLARRI